jgi:hypothetical protein
MSFDAVTAIATSVTAAAAVAAILISRREKKPHVVGTLHQEGSEFYINIQSDKSIPRCKVYADTTLLKVRGEEYYEDHLSATRNFDLPAALRSSNPQINVYSGKDKIDGWWLNDLLFRKP